MTHTVRGRVRTLETWRVVAGAEAVADGVRRVLGGTVGPGPDADGQWEVMSQSRRVHIADVEKSEESNVTFRLAEAPSLGRFRVKAGTWGWNAEEREIPEKPGPLCVLSIHVIRVKTLTGVMVQYRMPFLALADVPHSQE